MKVLKVTNSSDRVIQGIRAQVTASSAEHLPIPHNLEWLHSDDLLADITPGHSAYVVLGMTIAMGMSLEHGRTRDWIEMRGFVDPGERGATLAISCWATEEIHASQSFRLERPYPFRESWMPDYEWLPKISYEGEPG